MKRSQLGREQWSLKEQLLSYEGTQIKFSCGHEEGALNSVFLRCTKCKHAIFHIFK